MEIDCPDALSDASTIVDVTPHLDAGLALDTRLTELYFTSETTDCAPNNQEVHIVLTPDNEIFQLEK